MPDSNEFSFEYTIRVSRRSKNVRLSVRPDGKVVITKPSYISQASVRKFVAQHQDWVKIQLKKCAANPAPLLGRRSRREYISHKEQSRILVYSLIRQSNALYGYSFRSVRISNQKTRWGSCSAQKNLNFNYKIIFLPPALQKYVIVHELCHLEELNHSERFWCLVSILLPDWRVLRRELKKY